MINLADKCRKRKPEKRPNVREAKKLWKLEFSVESRRKRAPTILAEPPKNNNEFMRARFENGLTQVSWIFALDFYCS